MIRGVDLESRRVLTVARELRKRKDFQKKEKKRRWSSCRSEEMSASEKGVVEKENMSMSVNCGRCGQEQARLKCGKCMDVSYCSSECQIEHWTEHKGGCKLKTAARKENIRKASMILYNACSKGNMPMVVRLLSDGVADVNWAEPTGGASPLYVASENNHFEVVKLLIENHADVNLANNKGATPVWIASQEGNFEVVKLLIENHADVNLASDNNKGATPLMLLVRMVISTLSICSSVRAA